MNPVTNKKELIDSLLLHQDDIKFFGVKKLGIFGSFVKDKAQENSDVDFYVEFFEGKKNFDTFMELVDLLESITGRNIELITPQSLSKYIGPYILKEVEYVNLAA